MKSFLVVILILNSFAHLWAQDLVDFDYELDAYYSNVSAFIDLDTDENITDAADYTETQIYTDLILNSLSPNIFLLEAAVHPMPVAGLYIRDKHEEEYDKSNFYEINMVKAITAGFEEPYSFSFFVGRMIVFKNKDSQRVGKNRAYMGYLLSVGDYSIKDNIAHYDKWVNIEFKLKGTRSKEYSDLDWSFRVGSKIHENKNFVNTTYIGARRSSTNFNKGVWSVIYNSAFSTMISLSNETYRVADAKLILEKKWPLKWTDKTTFGLEVGYIFNSGEKYRGLLVDEGIDNHQFVFHPNLKF